MDGVLVVGFPAGTFAANCYVVAAGAGHECVIIDPGEGALAGIDEVVREHRLAPVAVLLTHGHLDHMWSALPVCRTYGAPCWIHPEDRHLLSDPRAGLPPEWAGALGDLGVSFAEPDDVRELADGMSLSVAGMSFVVAHAPGHTRGSVMFRIAREGRDEDAATVPEPDQSVGSVRFPHRSYGLIGADSGSRAGTSEWLFSGDLLFAGSIGRTDLPGGDHATILHSLSQTVLPLDDTIRVLPGHGDQTTIGHERATNPFLRDLVSRSG